MSRPTQAGISFRPLIIRFVDWFWPRFNAHAFVLSRLNEYEADAVAARTAGAPQLAASLQRLALHSRHLVETVWPEIWKAANKPRSRPKVSSPICARRCALAPLPKPTAFGWKKSFASPPPTRTRIRA